jgi:diaminohydroxyphosphoribosylaminopyrimidine deaminase/5-amino-6-(5-phosphoribosylamino)uracil reductase
VFVGREAVNEKAEELRGLGAEVVAAPTAGGRIDLRFVLRELGARGIRGVLVEGGGKTATGFVEEGLADKLTLFYAPRLIGSEGVPMIGALRATRMAESLRFRVSDVEKVGEDVAVTLYPARGEEGRVHRAS